MLRTLGCCRLAYRGLAITALVFGLSVGGLSCVHADTPSSGAAPEVSHVAVILGVPLTTAAWALLGLALMIAGLVASSRSGPRSPSAQTARPHESTAEFERSAISIRRHAEPSEDLTRVAAANILLRHPESV